MADTTQGAAATADKGKSKATEPAGQDASMDVEEDTSSEEELDEVRALPPLLQLALLSAQRT